MAVAPPEAAQRRLGPFRAAPAEVALPPDVVVIIEAGASGSPNAAAELLEAQEVRVDWVRTPSNVLLNGSCSQHDGVTRRRALAMAYGTAFP